MDTIGTILKDKGSNVFTVTPAATVLEAVETMARHAIGAILVCEGAGEPCGLFSERDLLNRVILGKRDPATTPVREVMTTEITVVEPETDMQEAMAIMTDRRCRHLPVVRDGALVGLVSIGDLVRWESRDHQFQIRVLTDYIHGKYPG